MLQQLEPIYNFDDFGTTSSRGLDKRWPLKDDLHYELVHDYFQKINYSVQDFNSTIKDGFGFGRKDTVFLIALTAWIADATPKAIDCFRPDVLRDFCYSSQQDLEDHYKFFYAIRSFVLAHPSSTDRHGPFGLDGNYICTDIGRNGVAFRMYNSGFSRLTIDGIVNVPELKETDVVLSVYSKRGGARFFEHMGFDMVDVRDAAALYLDKLRELGIYLYHARRADFE